MACGGHGAMAYILAIGLIVLPTLLTYSVSFLMVTARAISAITRLRKESNFKVREEGFCITEAKKLLDAEWRERMFEMLLIPVRNAAIVLVGSFFFATILMRI